jgi:hypothetical protein
MNQHIGSDFDDFLREEGIFAEVEAAAIKKVIACMITEAMAEAHINKSKTICRKKIQSKFAVKKFNQNLRQTGYYLIPSIGHTF